MYDSSSATKYVNRIYIIPSAHIKVFQLCIIQNTVSVCRSGVVMAKRCYTRSNKYDRVLSELTVAKHTQLMYDVRNLSATINRNNK